jgi:hypothetical protein
MAGLFIIYSCVDGEPPITEPLITRQDSTINSLKPVGSYTSQLPSQSITLYFVWFSL